MAARHKKGIKKRRLSPFSILLILTAVLTATAVVLVVIQNFDRQAGGRTTILDAPAGELAFTLEMGESSSLYPFSSSRLIRVGQSSIELLNLSGSAEDEVAIAMASPEVIENGQYALVFDQGGQQYYLLSRNGLLYSGNALDPIESASISASGNVALILDRSNTNGVLTVLDEYGDLLMEWVALDAQNSGYVIFSEFAEDSSYIDVSLLNTNRAERVNLVNRFSLESNLLGERIAQYQIDVQSTIVSMVHQNGQTAFISEREIKVADGSQMLDGASFGSILSVAAEDSGISILATETLGGQYALYHFSEVSALDPGTPLMLENNPGMLVSSGRYTAVADGEIVWFVVDGNLSNAVSYDMKSSVHSISIDESGNLLVVCHDAVRRIQT